MKGRQLKRPFTSLYLMAIEMGFSEERIRNMTLPQLNAFIQAYNDMRGGADESERWATQEDIDMLA